MTRDELTNETRISFKFRSGFSTDSDVSTPPPHRVASLELQGAHSESQAEVSGRTISAERVPSAAAVATHLGGAFTSKRTRKTRPWNVSDTTAVVASRSIREAWLLPDSVGITTPNQLARNSKGGSCDRVARKGSRILDSSVQSASGRGRSRDRPLDLLLT
jgi:hypothetical protein